jgi:hypothetical protein
MGEETASFSGWWSRAGRWQVARRVHGQPDEHWSQLHQYFVVLPTPTFVDGQTNQRERSCSVAFSTLFVRFGRKIVLEVVAY